MSQFYSTREAKTSEGHSLRYSLSRKGGAEEKGNGKEKVDAEEIVSKRGACGG